jgi:hypothetical protein
MRLALVALPLALLALAQPAQAAVVGYDCTLRAGYEGWTGPEHVRFEIDPENQLAMIADLGAPGRVWIYVDRPADNYEFKVTTDEFGSHTGSGFARGSGDFLDIVSIETQNGRMMWVDKKAEFLPATFWACTAL